MHSWYSKWDKKEKVVEVVLVVLVDRGVTLLVLFIKLLILMVKL